MKVTELRFPTRSRFLEPVLTAIERNRAELQAGQLIEIYLGRGGYEREGIATIEASSPDSFWVNKRSDPTRFSARIRAAALALYESHCFGQFEIVHFNGRLTIRRLTGTQKP